MSQQPIPFPQMGVSVDEGTIVEWHVAEGDTITVDQVVCDISTDKVDTEVQSPVAGTIVAILVAAGETAAVGAPLAMVGAEGEAPVARAAPAAPAGSAAPAPAAAASAAPAASAGVPAAVAAPAANGASAAVVDERAADAVPIDITTAPRAYDYGAEAAVAVPVGAVRWSPVARRIASEHGLDPAAVVGSGRHGRVRKADVLAAVQAGPAVAAPAAVPASPPAPVATTVAAAPAASTAGEGMSSAVPRGYEDVPFEIVATSPVRRAIAEHMTRSRHTAAHMTTEVEVDMHQVAATRTELNRTRLADGRGKLSYLPFIVRAACSALAEFPDLNATFEGERLIRWREINVGIAVDTDRGLLAPVIRGCEAMTVGTISDRIADLAARARDRTLSADDMRAGTFTVSNPGSVGAVSAPAIINQPQVAILGTPAIVKRPTVITGPGGDDMIAIRPIMLLALTFDHRAIDGAGATRGLVAIKQRLERWDAAAYS